MDRFQDRVIKCIERILEREKLSVQDLADSLDVSKQFIYMILSGDKAPSMALLNEIDSKYGLYVCLERGGVC